MTAPIPETTVSMPDGKPLSAGDTLMAWRGRRDRSFNAVQVEQVIRCHDGSVMFKIVGEDWFCPATDLNDERGLYRRPRAGEL